VSDFLDAGCPKELAFVMKHDIDTKPNTLPGLIKTEKECGIRSTLYVRACANDYNLLSYPMMKTLLDASNDGFEIGLHTNFVEYSKILGLEPLVVLKSEVELLRTFFDVRGMSTHRDFNYVHNALPFVEENWDAIKKLTNLSYQAYDPRLMDDTIYVNEGTKPHLCWRNLSPEDAIKTGKSIYMLTHNHWWHEEHPFEII
jgi:hypothetical protein